ncbi:hypothetical protein ACJX0J_007137 [Zea mays]
MVFYVSINIWIIKKKLTVSTLPKFNCAIVCNFHQLAGCGDQFQILPSCCSSSVGKADANKYQLVVYSLNYNELSIEINLNFFMLLLFATNVIFLPCQKTTSQLILGLFLHLS